MRIKSGSSTIGAGTMNENSSDPQNDTIGPSGWLEPDPPVKRRRTAAQCPLCQAEYREGFSRCSDCDVGLVAGPEGGCDDRVAPSVVRGEEARYRDGGGPWLYGVGLVALAAYSVFLMVGSFTENGGWIVFAMGVGFAIWTWWYGVFYVYEWTLHEDGRLETSALFRRRVDTITDLKHDRGEDVDRWLLKRAGDRRRIHLSATSGEALADALRARDASKLIHDPEPPPPSPLVVQAPRQVP